MDRLETEAGEVLRPWGQGDVQAVLDAFAPADMSGRSAGPITTEGTALEWIAAHQAAWRSGRGYTWAVTGGGEVLGSVSVSVIDRDNDTGWVSYFTLPAGRGRGIAAGGLRALSTWALGDLGLHRLELGHRVNNPASCAVATAAGFAVEGLEREKLRYGQERFDVELHARLASDPPPPEAAAAIALQGAQHRAASPGRGRDVSLDALRGDPASWLTLELGGAETLFPESAVDNLPPIARAEVTAGLDGALRQAIAAADPRGQAITTLRDDLVAQVSGTDPQRGAIAVADQVHLRRLVLRQVPPMIALGCLSWYGAYRHRGDPHADAITALRELAQAWAHHPEQRTHLDEQIRAIAIDVVGDHPTTLIDDPW